MKRIHALTFIPIFFLFIVNGIMGVALCAENPANGSASVSGNAGLFPEDFPVKGPDIHIYVTQTNESITIDGNLDEPAWDLAEPYNDYFFQLEPLDRAPSSEKTEIRVLQDNRMIYFGARCYDSEPEKIFASAKRRDGSFLDDDMLEILLDTFQDKRNSYAFGTNPYGVKVDAIISDEGNHINVSWNCVWYCKAKIHDYGWTVEMAIPFKSLNYKQGELVDWGINISREIKHRTEETYLVPVPRGLGHNGKFKGSLFATLKNIRPPSYRLNMEVQPYAAAGKTYRYSPDNVDSELNGGLDVRYHITPQLTFDGTVKTDFAQVEADEEIINVTRFNINLPEKRDFFLENAGLFTFGSGTSAGGSLVGVRSSSGFMLFNSRTIGIKNGEKIPLTGGAKVTGRIGRFSIGAMNIQSERKKLSDGTVEPAQNFTALKLKRDLFTNSNAGFMILNKQSAVEDYSRTVGGDVFLAFSPEFIVSGSVAKTFSPDDQSKEWAGNAGVILNKEWIDISVRYTHIDTLFNPEMGFVRRGNIRSTEGSVGVTKWINNDYLKSASFISGTSYITDHHNRLQTREHTAELRFTASSNDVLSIGVNKDYEFLPGDEFIRDIQIDQGNYDFIYQYVSFTSYRARTVAGNIRYRWGDSYDGRSKTLSLTNKTKISANLNMDLEYDYDKLDLRNGSLDAHLLAGRWTYAFSTELFAKCYVQWNDADHKFATNLLIDYIYKPRSHIYLVYNENRGTGLSSSYNKIKDRIVLLKVTYLLSI